MKVRNTTSWPDYFLRRMVSWCCKQIQLPARVVLRADFGRRSKGAYNGRVWYGARRIRVVIGPEKNFPVPASCYPGRKGDAFLSPPMNDQIEALVSVTAHELEHLYGRTGRARLRGERHTRSEERRIHALFVADRDALIFQWSVAPAQRKLKLAQTKVRKLKRKAVYYDHAIACPRKGVTQEITTPPSPLSAQERGTEAAVADVPVR